MKIRFKKTILSLTIISMLPMLSGFCIFQLTPGNLTGINIAQAAATNTNSNNISSDDSSCGGEQATEQDSKQALPTTTNHDQNSLLPCCIDGSHNGVASIFQSFESSVSIPVAFLSQHQITISAPQAFLVINPILPPPAIALIKTTILRL